MTCSGTGSRSRGRIRAADREATDDAETIGADIEISEEHQANVKETNDLERKVKTRREHCNRLKRYAEWLKKNYPQYASDGGVNSNGHGFRKGGAVHASSGTTHPASFTSVASRGEWSISKVLDQYFQWAATGDHQLGRSMCLLDPNHPNFAVLPPHRRRK